MGKAVGRTHQVWRKFRSSIRNNSWCQQIKRLEKKFLTKEHKNLPKQEELMVLFQFEKI